MKFKGTLEERKTARSWLISVLKWIRITGKYQPEDMRVLMFSDRLELDAQIWFDIIEQRAKDKGQVMTLQLCADEFLTQYWSGTVHMVEQMELGSLIYGKGKCVDVVSTQTEFERLASSLYPGASLIPMADKLLAGMFADVYKKGDFRLWEKAVEMNPVTLDQWKAAVQRAFIIRQTVVEGRKALLRNATQITGSSGRHFHSSSSSGTANVHHVDVSSLLSDSEEEGDDGEEVVPGEKLQQMGTAKKGTAAGPRTGPKDKKRYIKFLTTFAEREVMMRKGQCFHCYKAGHRAAECPDRSKPARRPTTEELNL